MRKQQQNQLIEKKQQHPTAILSVVMVLINIDYRLIGNFFFIDKFYSIVFIGQ